MDYREAVALLALVGGEVVGVGAYDSVGRAEGEIAFTISDAHQGRGLGSVLLEHLAAVARENGIHRSRAEVLSGNKRCWPRSLPLGTCQVRRLKTASSCSTSTSTHAQVTSSGAVTGT